MVGTLLVKLDDYGSWYCDLVYEVDRSHPGARGLSVVYNACVPLSLYNIESLLSVCDAFKGVARLRDCNMLLLAD